MSCAERSNPEDIDIDSDFTDIRTSYNDIDPDTNNSPRLVDQDMNVVLDYLMELHRLDNSPKGEIHEFDELAIENASRMNDQMQEEVKRKIMDIDRKMEENTKMLARIREAALLEYRATKKVKIHGRYKNETNYFPNESAASKNTEHDNIAFDRSDLSENDDGERDDERESEDEESGVYEQEDSNLDKEGDSDENILNKSKPPQKAWSSAERKRLAQGIRAIAQRGIVLDLQEKQQEWKIWELDSISNEVLENYPVNKISWKEISNTYVKTWVECLIQWTTQEHPSINKRPWGKAETEKLAEIVEKKGPGKWEEVAAELGTNRTISQCFSNYMAHKNNTMSKRKFTKEEDQLLKDAVKLFGNWNWQQVASVMENRTGQQCLHRWAKSLDPSIKRTPWTPEEDQLLTNAVKLYGAGNWRKIQRLIKGRIDAQCRERWMNVLHPFLNKTKMTVEELEKVDALVQEHGTKWSHIATFFPGRTDNLVMKQYKNYLINKADPQGPKRKGRPPNKAVRTETVSPEMGGARKRGRPPKEQSKNKLPSPKKRRGRGRPRKST